MTRRDLLRNAGLVALGGALAGRDARAQNIVDTAEEAGVAAPIVLTQAEADAAIDSVPPPAPRTDGPETRRIADKLEAHVADLIAGFPFRPFHHVLGISGNEIYFDHPDRLFHALTLALPLLSKKAAGQVRALLATQAERTPPYAADGYDHADGRARESYDVPSSLRSAGRGKAQSAFGVYAFDAYARAEGAPLATRLPALRARMEPLLSAPYPFDPARRDYAGDEAQKLNGDIAGLIGLARLARAGGDPETERRGRVRVRDLLELRVNLERLNPHILEKTNSTSLHLHAYKLARYCDLVPEVAELLRTRTEGLAASRLRAFREARPAWYLAYGERTIGGENYVSPPHLAHALFTGAALIERQPADRLRSFVDVPWCRGDLYFVEKCALALRPPPAAVL